jgi:hypothetical protein
VFTRNNRTDEDVQAVTTVLGPTGEAVMDTCSREVGREGTPHLQGFLKFTTLMRRRKVERLRGGRAFLKVAKGSDHKCRQYCEKEQNFFIQKNIRRRVLKTRRDDNDKWLTIINDA